MIGDGKSVELAMCIFINMPITWSCFIVMYSLKPLDAKFGSTSVNKVNKMWNKIVRALGYFLILM